MKLSLEPKHRRLLKGHTVQLKPEHLEGKLGDVIDLVLDARKMKMLTKAKARGKGCRLHLTEEEIEGSGLKEFFAKVKKGLKTAGKFYKKHLKEDLGPILKKGVKTALDAGVVALSAAQPELAPGLAVLNDKLGDKIVQTIGDTTGAYGMMCCPSCAGRGMVGGAMGCPPERFGSNAIYVNPAVSAPQYWPGFGMPPQYVSYGGAMHTGGSFRAI